MLKTAKIISSVWLISIAIILLLPFLDIGQILIGSQKGIQYATVDAITFDTENPFLCKISLSEGNIPLSVQLHYSLSAHYNTKTNYTSLYTVQYLTCNLASNILVRRDIIGSNGIMFVYLMDIVMLIIIMSSAAIVAYIFCIPYCITTWVTNKSTIRGRYE